MFGAKKIKSSEKYEWTRHAQYKMQQYGLSAQRITRVIRNPERLEEGIVPKTIAVMQPASLKMKDGKKTWSQEIWAMYQLRGSGAISKLQFPTLPTGRQVTKKIPNSKFQNSKIDLLMKLRANETKKLKIISAWRYPGVSPENNPIPEEILEELSSIN